MNMQDLDPERALVAMIFHQAVKDITARIKRPSPADLFVLASAFQFLFRSASAERLAEMIQFDVYLLRDVLLQKEHTKQNIAHCAIVFAVTPTLSADNGYWPTKEQWSDIRDAYPWMSGKYLQSIRHIYVKEVLGALNTADGNMPRYLKADSADNKNERLDRQRQGKPDLRQKFPEIRC